MAKPIRVGLLPRQKNVALPDRESGIRLRKGEVKMGYLLWLDVETTGLDPNTDALLEVHAALASKLRPFDVRNEFGATLRFDLDAETLPGEGESPPKRVIHPVVLEMHKKNGLWDACKESTMSLHVAEARLIDLIPGGLAEGLPIHLAGNSVHFDRAFLRRHMPMLEGRLHHRHFDNSSIKMFCEHLGMRPFPKPIIAADGSHRAKADVHASIDEARACAHFCGALLQ